MAVVPASCEWIVVAQGALAVIRFRVADMTVDTPEPSPITLLGLSVFDIGLGRCTAA